MAVEDPLELLDARYNYGCPKHAHYTVDLEIYSGRILLWVKL